MSVGSRRRELSRILIVEHYARVAHDAMRQQNQRLLRQPPKLGDGYLFAIALADLLKAARVAQKVAPSRVLKTALVRFERAIPLARDFRDYLEHWDDYADGKGRQQARLGLKKGDDWFWWKDTSPPILGIGGARSGLALEVHEANREAATLYAVASETLRAAREGR